MQKFDESNQPHFLFIITPPYSGSTAISGVLNSSHRTMILQKSGEGQWLVPGLCEKDRLYASDKCIAVTATSKAELRSWTDKKGMHII